LPVEFTRQSQDSRITLVITTGAKLVPVLWSQLRVRSIEESRDAFRTRDGCSINAVGYWTPAGATKTDETAIIGQWAKAKGITGVVWTALKPKFGDTYRIAMADD
jgi:hypothetical protein